MILGSSIYRRKIKYKSRSMFGGYVSLEAKTWDIEVTADDGLARPARDENKRSYSWL
jgi:hypothetical protein